MKRDIKRGFAWTLGGLLAIILARFLQTIVIITLFVLIALYS